MFDPVDELRFVQGHCRRLRLMMLRQD